MVEEPPFQETMSGNATPGQQTSLLAALINAIDFHGAFHAYAC